MNRFPAVPSQSTVFRGKGEGGRRPTAAMKALRVWAPSFLPGFRRKEIFFLKKFSYGEVFIYSPVKTVIN